MKNLAADIIYLIESNDDLIEYKNNQIIIILNALKNAIINLIKENKNKIFNDNDLIKLAIRKALELKKNDVIIIKQEHIFVKIINRTNRNNIAQNESKIHERRFNGIDKRELEVFYSEHFSKEISKNFFKTIVEKFVELYFEEQKIDNHIYEKNVFVYIQRIIIAELIVKFEQSEEFLTGFSGYAFRMHFNSVFDSISEYILKEISISNEYMIDFLKYYSLDIIIVDGMKYKVPEFETDDGLKWNVISMLSISKIYTRTRTSVNKLQKEVYSLDDQILKLFIDNLSPTEHNKIHLNKKEKLTDELRFKGQKLEDLLDEVHRMDNKERTESIKNEIKVSRENIKTIKRALEQLVKKEIKRSLINKQLKLERELDSMHRELKAQEKILFQNKDSFLSIKKSLLKALISKKQRI
ncbi:hypothetical protein [Sulfurimonas sp.]|uniref:hypothetical protein n=1 Tax=Sulfurimonas sp. TaxID=2022749 RepID=UPI0025E657DE|nr:hypothetical protein [Sulfurimonas sp.]